MLTSIQEYKEKSYFTPTEYLDHTYNYSGEGSLARTYIHKKEPFAVKILRSRDLGYESYIEAIEGSDNPIFPKVYKVVELDTGQKAFYMEILYHLDYFSKRDMLNFRFLMDKIKKRIINGKKTGNDSIEDASDTINLVKMLEQDKGHDIGIDLHSGNFMFRKNGEIVIIDPLVDWDNLKKSTEYSYT